MGSVSTRFTTLVDFRRLDALAAADSPLHRLDARAKLLVSLAFVACVMSFDRYAVLRLLPFAAFPLFTMVLARVPPGWLLRKLALVLPLALIVALPNPWFDRAPLLRVGGIDVAGGWISALSIVLRTLLATSAALLLVAASGFPALCTALERLHVPQPLVVQLAFLYRYLTLLGDEAQRMAVARELRGNGQPLSIRLYGALAGSLLLRAWSRAERVYLAMRARGFDGRFPARGRAAMGRAGWLYLLAWCSLFALWRSAALAAWPGTAWPLP
jgi:cobalt/nickel transport system permease protein